MYQNFEITQVQLSTEKKQQKAFLHTHNLKLEKNLNHSILLKDGNNIIGTGAVSGEILKCIAIDDNYRGEGLLSKIVTHLLNFQYQKGIHHNFVYTTPRSSLYFTQLGFSEIATTDHVALLEIGQPDISDWLTSIKHQLPSFDKGTSIGSIVVNCNPFSLGHRYLIETAAANSDYLILFVVEEDRSYFPFEHRYELVKRGVENISNVFVFPSGKYIISNAVFPSYFIKDESSDIVKIHTELDITIFGQNISKSLGINKRFVGTEPYCKTTATYNVSMKTILSQFGVDLVEIQRKKLNDLTISASYVRKGIREGDWELIKQIVPYTTWKYLRSGKAIAVLDKIKASSDSEDKAPK